MRSREASACGNARLRNHNKVKDLLYLSPNAIEKKLKGAITNTRRIYLPFFEQEEMEAFYGELGDQVRAIEEHGEQKRLTLTLTEAEGKRMVEIVKKKGIIPKTSLEWILEWAEVGIELAREYGVATPEDLLKEVKKGEKGKEGKIDKESLKEMLKEIREEEQEMKDIITEGRNEAPKIQEINKHAQLKGNKAERKVQDAIETIMAFNDEQERKEDKWLINFNIIKHLTKGGQKVIQRVLDARKEEIMAHNQRHELGDRHNVYKGAITDVIEWHWEGER